MGTIPKGLTVERKDNNGPYCSNNCRLATRAEQSRNTRRNVRLTAFKETKIQADWAKQIGIDDSTLRRELANGKSLEVIISKKKPEYRSILFRRFL
jgi:hypothetical protein